MSTASTSQDLSLVGVLLSACLFFGSAFLSNQLRREKQEKQCQDCLEKCQALLRQLEAKKEQASTEQQNHHEDQAQDLYFTRRLEERLSFENLANATLLKRKSNSKSLRLLKYDDDDDPPYGEDDREFYPKNSNWSHFELAEEDGLSRECIQNQVSFGGEEQHFVWTRKNSSRHVALAQKSHYDSASDLKKSPLEDAAPATPQRPQRLSRAITLDNHHVVMAMPNGVAGMRCNAATATPLSPPNALRRCSSYPALGSAHKQLMTEEQTTLSGLVRKQHRTARAQYNARIMPDRLILIRHGESMGNINEHLYATTPDNAMPLTKLGWEQARAAGKHLKEVVLQNNNAPVHFIVSPYVRTVETFHGICSAWCDPAEYAHIRDPNLRQQAWYSRLLELGLTWHEDPRIREQDFGNYQVAEKIKQAKRDRHAFGPFYYRFAHGESASDVYDRVSTFLDSLWRSFDVHKSQNYVLVTHGVSIRVILARYFRYTIDQFNLLSNPRNCEMVELRHDGDGRLELGGRYNLVLQPGGADGETHVVGCQYSKKLKVLPHEYFHKVKIRISYDDQEDEQPNEATAKHC